MVAKSECKSQDLPVGGSQLLLEQQQGGLPPGPGASPQRLQQKTPGVGVGGGGAGYEVETPGSLPQEALWPPPSSWAGKGVMMAAVMQQQQQAEEERRRAAEAAAEALRGELADLRRRLVAQETSAREVAELQAVERREREVGAERERRELEVRLREETIMALRARAEENGGETHRRTEALARELQVNALQRRLRPSISIS